MKPEFKKFPSIRAFKQVRKDHVYTVNNFENVPETLWFRPKIKLHGTNAGIAVSGNEVYAQKRSYFATVEDDNYGFAAWVESVKDHILNSTLKDYEVSSTIYDFRRVGRTWSAKEYCTV